MLNYRGGGTRPASPVLDGPLFGNQVMNIQKCYPRVYMSFECVKVNGAAQKQKDTPFLQAAR